MLKLKNQKLSENEILEKLSKTGYHYQKRLERIKESNFIAELDSNEKLVITSYDWWPIIKNINGIYFYNGYNYSKSTCKHQLKARRIMLDLKIDCISVSFDDLNNQNLITIIEQKINALIQCEIDFSLLVNNKNYEYRKKSLQVNYNQLFLEFQLLNKKLDYLYNDHSFYTDNYDQKLGKFLDNKLEKFWRKYELKEIKKELKNSTENEITI